MPGPTGVRPRASFFVLYTADVIKMVEEAGFSVYANDLQIYVHAMDQLN